MNRPVERNDGAARARRVVTLGAKPPLLVLASAGEARVGILLVVSAALLIVGLGIMLRYEARFLPPTIPAPPRGAEAPATPG